MEQWADVEVISVKDDEEACAEGQQMEEVGTDSDEEIFSQEPVRDEFEELSIGQIRDSRRGHESRQMEEGEEEEKEEETTIGEARENRLQWLPARRNQRQGGCDVSTPRPPPVRRGEASWKTGDTIDLTGDSPISNLVGGGPVLSFREEYDELLSGLDEEWVGSGLWFPFEAVAELLLRHPEHWWCRYPEAMEEMLLSLGEEAEGGGSTAAALPVGRSGSVMYDDSGRWNTTGVDLVWQEASTQLCMCRRCLNAYHAAQGRVRSRLSLDDSEERSAEIARFMAAILAQDRLRLQRSFCSAVDAAKVVVGMVEAEQTCVRDVAGPATVGRNGGSSEAGARAGGGNDSRRPSSVKLGVEATLAFWEVLSFWELLDDDGIEKAFVEALGQINECGAECFAGSEWERHWPGVLILLVHRDAQTRAWAQSMARKADRISAKEYREVFSPVIDRWVPVLERGLFQPTAVTAGGDEKERLHWSGLHVTLQLLEPGAAPLLTSGFPTLVDLILQKFDDGPGDRVVSLYLQVCGCFAALLRLLGTGIWSYSSLLPHEVLGAVEQRVHGGEGAAGEGAGQAGLRLPNEAVHKKTLEILPLLVSSSAGVQSCAISRGGGRDDGNGAI